MEPYGIWIIAGVIALIAELLVPTFFMMWVAGGCFVAAIVAAIFPQAAWAPWAAFVVSTLVLLYLGQPLARRLREKKLTPSNVDAVVGREGVVLETIDPAENTGRVRIGSEEWRARADEHIERGNKVCVLAVEGATLVVTEWGPGTVYGSDATD